MICHFGQLFSKSATKLAYEIQYKHDFFTVETGPKKKINFSPHNFREKNKWGRLTFFPSSWKWRKECVSLDMYFYHLWIYSGLGSSDYVHSKCTSNLQDRIKKKMWLFTLWNFAQCKFLAHTEESWRFFFATNTHEVRWIAYQA